MSRGARAIPGSARSLVAGLLALSALLLAGADPAAAQAEVADIDAIDTAFQEAVDGISGDLVRIARNLLFSLLLIEVVWSFGRIVMNGGDIGRVLSALFQRVIIVGFFLFLLEGLPLPGGRTVGISQFILTAAEGLMDITIQSSIKPADVFGDIFWSGAQIYDASGTGFGRLAAALVWLALAFFGALIAGIMLVAYVRIYVAFTVGILALGFGAWRETSNIARNFIFSALGQIFRLFTLLLMVAVIRIQLDQMMGFDTFGDGVMMIGMLVIFVMTLISVPAQVESIVASGSAPSAEGRVVEAGTYAVREAGRRTVGAGISAAGSGMRAGLGAAAGTTGSALKTGTRATGDRLAAAIRAIQTRGGP